MKRVLSIVLALSLIAGLMTGLTLTASAETDEFGNTLIETIDITDVTAPAAGAMPTAPDSIIANNDYAGFKVTNASWEFFNHTDGTWDWHDPATAFAAGTVYRIFLDVATKNGYSFNRQLGEGIGVTVGGTPVSYASVWGDGVPYDNVGQMGLVYLPDGIQMIDSVSLTGIPAMEAGTSTNTSAIAAPAGANYTVSNAMWSGWDINDNHLEPVGATLEDGNLYNLSVVLTPKEGYWFADRVTMNDAAAECNVGNWGCEAFVYYYCDLRPVIDSVELTATGTPAAGAAINSVTVTAPADAKYSINTTWKTWNPHTGDYDAVTGTFGYNEYRLEVEIVPDSGYTIIQGVAPTINGKYHHEIEGWQFEDPDGTWENGYTLVWGVYIDPENGFIHSVDMSGGPESITVGGNMTNPTITVNEGEVTVTGTKWLNSEMEPATGKFEDGKVYYLAVSLAAKDGYAFADWVGAHMNGKECRNCEIGSDYLTATAYFHYSLLPVIEKVDITLTEPVIGAAPGAVKLPDGVKFVFDSDETSGWYIYNGGDFEKFENGQKYIVDIYLKPVDGYEFADDVVITINGEVVDEDYFWGNAEGLNVWQFWSFKKVIQNINITVPNYKVGDVFNPDDITLPEGVNYEMGGSYASGQYTDPYTAFGKDRYSVGIEVIAKEGYEFAEDAVITVNGKEPGDYYGDDTVKGIYYEFSLCEQITKIEFPALPTVNVGDTLQYQVLQAPDGAKYYSYSGWYDADMNPFNGTVEGNKVYFINYIAEPMEGYEFSEDCVVTVGGQAANFPIMRVEYNMAVIAKQYNFGVPTIDKVELTITAPAAGEKPSTTVTVPEGAKYEVSDLGWYASKTGNKESGLDYVGNRTAFTYGNYYFAAGEIQAKDGYVFAEDAQIFVNGKAVEMEIGERGTVLAGTRGQIFYGFDKLEEAYDDNPKTGVVGIGIATAMMALSATAAGVIISKKKEF